MIDRVSDVKGLLSTLEMDAAEADRRRRAVTGSVLRSMESKHTQWKDEDGALKKLMKAARHPRAKQGAWMTATLPTGRPEAALPSTAELGARLSTRLKLREGTAEGGTHRLRGVPMASMRSGLESRRSKLDATTMATLLGHSSDEEHGDDAPVGHGDLHVQASERAHHAAGHGSDDEGSVGSPPMLPPAVAHARSSRCGAPSMSAPYGIERLGTDRRAQLPVRHRAAGNARRARGSGGVTHQAPGGLAHVLTIARRAHAHGRRDATARPSASALRPSASAPAPTSHPTTLRLPLPRVAPRHTPQPARRSTSRLSDLSDGKGGRRSS